MSPPSDPTVVLEKPDPPKPERKRINTKQKGNNNEYKTMRYYAKQGYRCCRSAASLGAWDIIGIGLEDVVLLQVKSNRLASPAERQTMADFQAPPLCRKLLVIWYDRNPTPRIIDIPTTPKEEIHDPQQILGAPDAA